jgi:nucleotide-binding universal stress UspA family protein
VGEAFAPTPDTFVQAEHNAEDVLRAALQQVQGKSLEVEAVAEEGGPAAILLEQAAGAELLVVGSRGRGATKRLMLGSVSHDLAHHASCPLVIARA